MLEDYFFTKNTRYVLWGAFAVLVALLIFHAGVVIGEHEPRMHPGPGMQAAGPLGKFMPKEAFMSGHGAVGEIATVTLPTFTLITRDNETQQVETGSSTSVEGGPTGTVSDLVRGETVIVIGDPQAVDTDGQNDLDARIVKILPSPPDNPNMKVMIIKQ